MPSPRTPIHLLAVARFASSGGTQAAQIALAYSIYEETGSAAWVSAALVASAGVVGLVGPVSGRLADRVDRRRLMVVTELLGAVGWLAAVFAPTPAVLVGVALLATAANAPFKAAASASVPNLAPPGDLAWANGTVATAVNASLVVGPLVGGAMVGATGPGVVFAANAATFVASAILISRVKGSFAVDRSLSDEAIAPPARWRDVAGDPYRRGLVTVTTLTFAAFGVTLVADLPLVDHFDGGAVAYALLTTLWGIGAVVGSALAGRTPRQLERRALVTGTAAMAVSLASLSVAPNLPVAIGLGTIGGVGSGIAFTPWFSLLQRATPDAERGTVFALAETCEQSAFVAGMIVAGAVVGVLGAPATYLIPGVLLLAATAVGWRLPEVGDTEVSSEVPGAGDQHSSGTTAPDETLLP